MRTFCRLLVVVAIIFSEGIAHAMPTRIVSLKPNVTEILFALGVGDRVVGVTTYCDYPAAAKNIPRVADYVKPYAERIIALAPDLIIGAEENSSKKAVMTLENVGFAVALYRFATLDETFASIEAIGARVGARDRAQKLVREMKNTFEKMRARHVRGMHPKTLIVCGHRPLVVAGAQTFMDELVTQVGATNVAASGTLAYPHWSAEQVIGANPEIIIDMGMGSEAKLNDTWKDFHVVDAVKNARIYRTDDSLFRAGPRLMDAVKQLENAIYGSTPPL